MTTLGQIKTEVYNLMNQSSDSSTYSSNTRLQTKINNVIQDVCKGEYRSIMSDEVFKAGDLRFLRGKQSIVKYDDVSLTSEINIGDTIINIDTTNFLNSGMVLINGNLISYNGKNATQLLDIDGIIMAQDIGQTVKQVFKVNETAFKAFALYKVVGNNNIGPDKIEVPYQDERDTDGNNIYYTLVNDAMTNDLYVDIRGFAGKNSFWLEYYKVVLDYVDDMEDIVIPSNYGISVIAPIVAGELLRESEQTEEAIRKLQLAYSKLITFYNQYNQLVKQRRKTIKFKGPSTNSTAPFYNTPIRQNQIFKY